MLKIEVVYAGDDPVVVALEVEAGTTLRQAIERSGLEVDLKRMGVGVFGRARGLDERVVTGDRVEIYRPLPEDPREVRRRRAKKQP